METTMNAIDVAIIGAGQAGLAMSRWLAMRNIDHLLFERGEVGANWKSHAWDSLRLLTPNWLNGLPSSPYQGDDADGFMRADAFLTRLRNYGATFSAPVLEQAEVFSLEFKHDSYFLCTSRGRWSARAVVIATGQCDRPYIPPIGSALDARILSLHSSQYRSPSALPSGNVLVVGASASGVQIAEEIRLNGREVTVAVGSHVRLPRSWRGRDIFWWMSRAGILAERTRDLPDPEAAKRQPTGQLAGRPDHSNVDLSTLQAQAVRLTGRLAAAEGDKLSLRDDLRSNVECAQARLDRLLARIDACASLDDRTQHDAIAPVDLPRETPRSLSLAAEGIRTLIWATGYRRDLSWLRIPAAIRTDGEIAHWDGVTAVPGLYALGFKLLRKRDSHFIGGVGTDAAAISEEIMAFLDKRARRAA
jgi:putative flavoprotein involved in K+ transport